MSHDIVQKNLYSVRVAADRAYMYVGGRKQCNQQVVVDCELTTPTVDYANLIGLHAVYVVEKAAKTTLIGALRKSIQQQVAEFFDSAVPAGEVPLVYWTAVGITKEDLSISLEDKIVALRMSFLVYHVSGRLSLQGY